MGDFVFSTIYTPPPLSVMVSWCVEVLVELVPDLVWYIERRGRNQDLQPENLRPPPPPFNPPPEPSLKETLLIVTFIHILFEFIR